MTSKPFNFKKKPKNPGFLMFLAKHILCWPDLKKRNAKLTKVNMEDIEDKPYLLLVTHSSMVDFNLMLKGTHPYKVNNVMTLEGFNTYTEPLMRFLGVIGTRKFVSDIYLIKNIQYSLKKLNNIFVLFPEARYSLDGCTSYIPDSLGKLIHILGVPVVLLKIHGNFITCPQWNKINKKTYVEAVMQPIISAGETRTYSVDKINKIIRDNFVYDDFKWQLENKIKIDHPERAKGLHCLLYQCCDCGKEFDMDSEGTRLFCRSCRRVSHGGATQI